MVFNICLIVICVYLIIFNIISSTIEYHLIEAMNCAGTKELNSILSKHQYNLKVIYVLSKWNRLYATGKRMGLTIQQMTFGLYEATQVTLSNLEKYRINKEKIEQEKTIKFDEWKAIANKFCSDNSAGKKG